MNEKVQEPEAALGEKQICRLLGVGRTTYFKIRRLGLLKGFRLYPGGPVRHTPQQYSDYVAHVARNEVVAVRRFPRRVERRTG